MFGDVARALGRVSRAALIAGFAISGGAALGLLSVAANAHHDVLVRVGGVIAVVLSVMLLIVVTWYRRESVVSAAIVLALAWTFARLVALSSATLVLWRSLGAVGYLMYGVLLGLPLAMLEALVVGGVLVAVLRRVRPRVAPLAISQKEPGA